MITTLLSLEDLINDFNTLNEELFNYSYIITESFPKHGEHTYNLNDLHITTEDDFIIFVDKLGKLLSSKIPCVLQTLLKESILSITLIFDDNENHHDYLLELKDGTIRIRVKI